MNTMPLRYSISSWKQASKCLSNSSKQLRITVTELCDKINLEGLRIAVEHQRYGTLFAYVINAKGDIVQDQSDALLTTEDILAQLAKYGFYITYAVYDRVTGDQIDYLLTIQKLGYQKVRVLTVYKQQDNNEIYTQHLVAFDEMKMLDWLSSDYEASEKEYRDAIELGVAVSLDNMSEAKSFDWSWLTYVANIDDIVRDYVEAGES